MLELKTSSEVDACASAGKIVADVLTAVGAHAAPGVTTKELDTLAPDLIADSGARPSFLATTRHGRLRERERRGRARALVAGIAAAVPGARMGDVAHAIGTIARAGARRPRRARRGAVDARGTERPDEVRPGRKLPLRPGLVIALEPMSLAGGADAYRHDRDGWTIRTADGGRAAHAEHTIAIIEDGPRVLTAGRPSE
jgi:methionyl aminopeptidase